MLRVIRRRFVPNKVVAFRDEAAGKVEAAAGGVPWLEGKDAVGGKPTAYVCESFHCKAPTTDINTLEEILSGTQPHPGGAD